jgi:DNA-binding transcriptional LysR family regulator
MTKAAERLHSSQPAVSAHIKALEDALGVALFLRTPKGMVLTQEGVELKAKVAAILEGVDDLRATADRLKGGIFGDIRLGVNTDPQLLKLTAIYAALNRHHPGLSLNMLETMSWDAARELLTGNLDLAFTYSKPDEEKVQAWHLDRIEMAVVAPSRWRERLLDIGLKDLTTFPWVWTSEHCPLCALQKEIFANAGIVPEKAVVVDQEAAILKLVSEGVGLSLMPVVKALNLADTANVIMVKKLEQKLDLFVIYLKRRGQDRKIAAILDVIGRVWGETKPGSDSGST